MKDHITLDSILAEIEQVRELALSVDDYKTALKGLPQNSEKIVR